MFWAKLLADATAGGLLEMITQLGLTAALVVFFVWQSGKRETRMSAAIEELQQFSQTRMVEVIERNTTAITNVTQVMQNCQHGRETRLQREAREERDV